LSPKPATDQLPSCEIVLVVAAPDFTLKTKVDQGFLYWGERELKAGLKIPSAVTLVLIWHERDLLNENLYAPGIDKSEYDRIVAECREKKIEMVNENSLVSLSRRIRPYLVESSFIRPAPIENASDLRGYRSFSAESSEHLTSAEFVSRLSDGRYVAEVAAMAEAGRNLRKQVFKPSPEKPPANGKIQTQRLELIDRLDLLKESVANASGKGSKRFLSDVNLVTAPILKALGIKARKKGSKPSAQELVADLEEIRRRVYKFDPDQIKLIKEVLGIS
jgi:hypothetical protein